MKCSVQNWLVHPDSITERLIEKAGEASLTVLMQGWEPVCAWDKKMLNDASNRVWRREIVMLAQGEACWYARTIVPESTYKSNQDFFEQLQTKSVGTLIFNSPTVQRMSLTSYVIDEEMHEYQWIPESVKPYPTQPLWVRLSYLMLHEQFPFYLVEILLPAAVRYNN